MGWAADGDSSLSGRKHMRTFGGSRSSALRDVGDIDGCLWSEGVCVCVTWL